MCADDDIHRARRKIFNHLARLALGSKTREQFHTHRIIRHAFAKIIKMLLCENRRRHENRNLFSVHHALERRANRHFGFSKTHIATDQTIHRLRAFLIRFRRGNGSDLIRRLLVDE